MTDVLPILRIFVGTRDAKLAVLEYFLEHPTTDVYPAQLASVLHRPEASIRRALHTLAQHEILLGVPTHYRHFFRIRPNIAKSWRAR